VIETTPPTEAKVNRYRLHHGSNAAGKVLLEFDCVSNDPIVTARICENGSEIALVLLDRNLFGLHSFQHYLVKLDGSTYKAAPNVWPPLEPPPEPVEGQSLNHDEFFYPWGLIKKTFEDSPKLGVFEPEPEPKIEHVELTPQGTRIHVQVKNKRYVFRKNGGKGWSVAKQSEAAAVLAKKKTTAATQHDDIKEQKLPNGKTMNLLTYSRTRFRHQIDYDGRISDERTFPGRLYTLEVSDDSSGGSTIVWGDNFSSSPIADIISKPINFLVAQKSANMIGFAYQCEGDVRFREIDLTKPVAVPSAIFTVPRPQKHAVNISSRVTLKEIGRGDQNVRDVLDNRELTALRFEDGKWMLEIEGKLPAAKGKKVILERAVAADKWDWSVKATD